MHSLAQLGDFVGLSDGRAQVAGYPPQTTLRHAGLLVTTLGEGERRSLRSVIDAVAQLPPITLAATMIGPRSGVDPLALTFRVSASPGAVWRTVVDGVELRSGTRVGRAAGRGEGGDFPLILGGTGQFRFQVVRTGLTAEGPITLPVRLDDVALNPKQVPKPPPDDPPIDPPPERPTCTVEPDPEVPVSDATVGIKVYGRGFGDEEDVAISMDGAWQVTTRSRVGGAYATTFSITRANPAETRRFDAQGQKTGRKATGGFAA